MYQCNLLNVIADNVTFWCMWSILWRLINTVSHPKSNLVDCYQLPIFRFVTMFFTMLKHYNSKDYLTYYTTTIVCRVSISVLQCLSILFLSQFRAYKSLFDVLQYKKIIDFIGRPKVQPSCKAKEREKSIKGSKYLQFILQYLELSSCK